MSSRRGVTLSSKGSSSTATASPFSLPSRSRITKRHYFILVVLFLVVGGLYMSPSPLREIPLESVELVNREIGEVQLYDTYEWTIKREQTSTDNPTDLSCGRVTVYLTPKGEPTFVADVNTLSDRISARLVSADKKVTRTLQVLYDKGNEKMRDIFAIQFLPEHQPSQLTIQINGESILSNERFGLKGEKKEFVLVEECSCKMERDDGLEIIPNSHDFFISIDPHVEVPLWSASPIVMQQNSLYIFHLKRRYSHDINSNYPYFVAYLQSEKEIFSIPIQNEDLLFRLDILTHNIPKGKYQLHILLLLLNSKEEPKTKNPVIHTGPWYNGNLEHCLHLRSHITGSPFTVYVEETASIGSTLNKTKEDTSVGCDSLNAPGRWVSENSVWRWKPFSCHFHYFTADDIFDCSDYTHIKWIHIMGAGELQEVANNIAQLFGRPSLEPQDQEFVKDNQKVRISYKRSTWASNPTFDQRRFASSDKIDLDPFIFQEKHHPDVVIINASMGNELLYQTFEQFKAWVSDFLAYFSLYDRMQSETKQKKITVIWFVPLFFWGPTLSQNKLINAARLKLFSDHVKQEVERNGHIFVADNFEAASSRVDCTKTGFLFDNPKDKSCLDYAVNHLLNFIYRDCKVHDKP